MSDEYQLVFHEDFARQLETMSFVAQQHPGGTEARVLRAALQAFAVVRAGQEPHHGGERLGFSKDHYDLRDCAEIKVQVLDERHRAAGRLAPRIG